MKYNNAFDTYAYDNIITYFYIMDKNSISNFYGALTNNEFLLDSTRIILKKILNYYMMLLKVKIILNNIKKVILFLLVI